MPGGIPPSRQSVRDLWSAIISFPIFGGLFVGVTLGVTLMGTPKDGEGDRFWIVLVVGGFLGVWATVPNVVYLSELARRRVWVPPGTARHPILVAIPLTVLLLAAGVTVVFAGISISRLAMPAVLRWALQGGLLGAAILLIIRIPERLARKLPVSEGNGATEPTPPGDRPGTMPDLRDLGIEVTESADGVRYRLPRRPLLGKWRPFCGFVIVFGLSFAIAATWGMGTLGMSGMARGPIGNLGIPARLTILILVFLVGLAASAFGLLMMAGRHILELTSKELVSFEGIGSLGWTCRRPLEGLRQFKVERLEAKRGDKPVIDDPLDPPLAVLRAEFESGKSLKMAWGYPHAWLRLIAEDITRRRPPSGDPSDPEAAPKMGKNNR
jgi:hypothetical protein